MGRLARRLLGISPAEVSFARRGFVTSDERLRRHLERVGESFVAGYTAALVEDDVDGLAARLTATPPSHRGFAYEGAAMAVTLRDLIAPWRRPRLAALLAGPGDPHTYLVHVGAGWALARLPVPVSALLSRLHPIHRWLALDGFGFHQGFFHWRSSVEAPRSVPRRVRGYGRRAFDQGLGRSLWFVRGADPEAIAATIDAFPAPRRPDLWSGVGLACAYAGGLSRDAVEHLVALSGPHRPQLAQGAVFAAKARQRAANLTAAAEVALEVICGLTTAAAAALSDEAMDNLPAGGEEPALAEVPAFELWRRGIARRFTLPRDEPPITERPENQPRGVESTCASSFAVTA